MPMHLILFVHLSMIIRQSKKPNNVHAFKGSLAATSLIEPTPNKGIIGLGGSSKHYEFR